MWSSVVLPAPLGPSSPVIPGPRLNVMSLTATTLPYHRAALINSIAGLRGGLDGARYDRSGSHAAILL